MSLRVRFGVRISIHASTQEATGIGMKRRRMIKNFNPRLHAGGDVYGATVIQISHISIHASTQEATEMLL